MNINRYTTASGLKLIHVQDPDATQVCVSILYRVGSKDEDRNLTGLAHLMEHLMFTDDYDAAIHNVGGETNAFTNQDFTLYYSILPPEYLSDVLQLELERMTRLNITDQHFKTQQSVVIEEFKERSINQPYGDIQHLLAALCYDKGHPYHSPTIGLNVQHIESIELKDVQNFYKKHYHPSNVIMAITGNVDYETVLDKLPQEWKMQICCCRSGSAEGNEDCAIKTDTQDVVGKPPAQLTVQREVPTSRLLLAYRMPAHNHKDYYLYDLLTDILAQGKSATLRRWLVDEQQLCTNVNAYITGTQIDGLLIITATPKDGVSLQEIEEQLKPLLGDMTFTEKQLVKCRNQRSFHQSLEQSLYSALAIALLEAAYFTGDPSSVVINPYKDITLADLQRVSKQLFNGNNPHNIIYYERCE